MVLKELTPEDAYIEVMSRYAYVNTSIETDNSIEDFNKKYEVNFTIPVPKKYVGAYLLGDEPYCCKFYLTVKPNWFHRFFMKLFLGFVWINDEC